jgi:hypothetical protein
LNTKKIIVFLKFIAAFALMLGMFASLVEPVKAAEQVTIVNHQGFLDYSGYYVVYGEVKNTGDTAAKNIYAKITFYDSLNAVLDEDETTIKLDVLMPGRKAPFGNVAGVEGTLVKSYTVELMDLTMSADSLPFGLEIVSSSSEVNAIHNMMINGQVKNSATLTATYVRVYATLYDGPSGTGNVVGVTSATAQPYTLGPGQTGSFQMGIFVTSGKSYSSYVLTAESDEYAVTTEYIAAVGQSSTPTPSSSASPAPSPSIPEFPSFIVIPVLIVTMLIAAVAVRRRNSKLLIPV